MSGINSVTGKTRLGIHSPQITPNHEVTLPDFDVGHFQKLPGILKSLQFILAILILDFYKPPIFYFFGQMALVLTASWILAYVFNVQKKYSTNTSWLFLELISVAWIGLTCAIGGLSLVISVAASNDPNSYLPAAICTLLTGILAGGETFLVYCKWRDWKATDGDIGYPIPEPEPRF